MKKKVLASLLAAAMLMLSVTGCGDSAGEGRESSGTEQSQVQDSAQESSEEGGSGESGQGADDALEPVTLRIFFIEGPAGDEEKVADYINSLPQVQALNVTIEICKVWNWDRSNLPLQLAGDEQMDIGWDDGASFISRVNQQAYADLSEYLENDPEFYNVIPEDLWKGTTLNGGIYGIPTYKEIGEQWALFTDTKTLDACNFDPDSVKCLADAEPLLAAMKEKDLGAIRIMNWQEWMKVGMFTYYDFLPYNLAGINRTEGQKVESLYATQEFTDFVNMMYDWNQKGYIPEETLTDSFGWVENQYKNKGNYCIRYMGYAPCAESAFLPDHEVKCMFLENPIVTNDATRGSIWGVYKKCKNPERAYQFLKLWNTDPEVKNAFLWGIPGEHYNLVDGQVELITGEDGSRSFIGVSYASGNVMINYTTVTEPKDKYEQYDAWNKTAVPAADLGITYDFEAVNDKVTNCTAVLDEYVWPLILGFVEPESGIELLNQKLQEAGIEDVVAHLQAQYDEFLATK